MTCDEPSLARRKRSQVMLLGNKAVSYGAIRMGVIRMIRTAMRQDARRRNGSSAPRISSPMVPDSAFRLIASTQHFVP
jgi:hypothetical protein